MATNTILISFVVCASPPALGYRVFYRPAGTSGAYREAGPFTSDPIQIVDTNDPLGTQYEGYIVSDCGGGKLGPHVPFNTSPGGSTSISEGPEFNYILSAAFGLNIEEVISPDLPDLPPTGVNGAQYGNHTGFPGGTVQIVITGTIIPIAKKLVALVDPLTVLDCQNITSTGTYTFIGLPAVPITDVLRFTINSGTC